MPSTFTLLRKLRFEIQESSMSYPLGVGGFSMMWQTVVYLLLQWNVLEPAARDQSQTVCVFEASVAQQVQNKQYQSRGMKKQRRECGAD